MANRFWPLSPPYGFAVAKESTLAGRTAAAGADGTGADGAGAGFGVCCSVGHAAAARAGASLESSLTAGATGRIRSVFAVSGFVVAGCAASTSRTLARTVRAESDPVDADFTAAGTWAGFAGVTLGEAAIGDGCGRTAAGVGAGVGAGIVECGVEIGVESGVGIDAAIDVESGVGGAAGGVTARGAAGIGVTAGAAGTGGLSDAAGAGV